MNTVQFKQDVVDYGDAHWLPVYQPNLRRHHPRDLL